MSLLDPVKRMDTNQRLTDIGRQVVRWREITGYSHPVEPGSSLGADDRVFPLVPPSHLIWHGISHAVDHLDMFMHPLIETKLSFPIAPQTLARSGVLGAAHALWMLDAATRNERQLRALRIFHEECRNERNAYDELAKSGDAAAGMADIVAVRSRWMAEAVQAGLAIGCTAEQVKDKPVETKLLDEVITRYQQVRPSPPGDGTMLSTYRLIWRMHSGVAHGYRWPIMYRADFSKAVLDGVDERNLGGLVSNNLDQLATSAISMSLLIGRAFELYNLRRVVH